MPGCIKYLRKRWHTNAVGQRAGSHNGNLTYIGQLTQNTTNNAGNRVVVSPDGKNLYCFWNNILKWYSISPTTGLISPLSTTGAGGYVGNTYGAIMFFSPDGLFLYCMGVWGGMYVWQRDPVTGFMTLIQTVSSAIAPLMAGGNTCFMALSPDSNQIYFTTPTSMRVLTRDPSTGQVSLLQTLSMSWGTQVALAVSPDGANVYWTSPNGQYGTSIYRYSRAGDGTLTYIDRIASTASVHLIVSPDNKFLYAAPNGASSPVKRFSRDLGTGQLTYVGIDVTLPGSMGLYNEFSISPDGVSLYVCNNTQVVQYARTVSTGVLTHVSTMAATAATYVTMVNDNFAYVSGNPMIQFSRS